MGTINYGTSEFVTLGFLPYDSDDYLDEDGNIDYEEMRFTEQCDFDNIAAILARYDFQFFPVEVEPGYYDGSYISIQTENAWYDDWQEKREALKELTQLQRFLLECLDSGMTVCYPGWCTSYLDHWASIDAVREAIREARQEVRNAPTWYTRKKHGITI